MSKDEIVLLIVKELKKIRLKLGQEFNPLGRNTNGSSKEKLLCGQDKWCKINDNMYFIHAMT